MRSKLLATAAIAAASFMFSAPALAAVVNNGGFETHDFTGWTQTGNTGFSGVQCPGPGSGVDSGNCSAFFGPVGSAGGITQNLATVAGQQYTISFALQTDGGNPSSFQALFGGTTLLSLANPAASSVFTHYAFGATASGSSTVLSFLFRDDPGFMLFDSVSIREGAVPEPSTWAMMLLGFGAIGLAARRRRRMTPAIMQRA